MSNVFKLLVIGGYLILAVAAVLATVNAKNLSSELAVTRAYLSECEGWVP